jgi:hypothetical protein
MADKNMRQQIVDEEHLHLLYISYLISAGMSVFFSFFGLIYVFMGVIMGVFFSAESNVAGHAADAPPAFIGWFFGIIGFGIFLFLIAMAVLKFIAAFRIKHRRSRVFCMVIAGISCLAIPYGTLLGICTFIVLARASVKKLFAAGNES